MIKKQRFFIQLAFCCFFIAGSVKAQDANWTVNSSEYQFNMTFTAFLNVDGVSLDKTADKVAAFVDGEVRGVANLSYVASSDKYVAYLTVYANTNKETIRFKIFNSTTNAVVDAVNTIPFEINAQKGSLFQSYGISNWYLSDFTNLIDVQFKGITPKLYTRSANAFDFVLPQGTDISKLILTYTTPSNEKVFHLKKRQTSGVSELDYSLPVSLTVMSENESILKEYTVNVFMLDENFTTTVVLKTAREVAVSTSPVETSVFFSQPITDFTVEDINVENAVIIDFKKIDNLQYTITAIPLSDGDMSLQVKRASVLDANNKTNLQSNKLSFIFDSTQPVLTHVHREINEDQSFFDFQFSEAVLNADISDFELVGRDAANFKISTSNYIESGRVLVEVLRVSGDEQKPQLFAQLKSDTDIIDAAQNKVLIQRVASYFLDTAPPEINGVEDVFADCEITITNKPIAFDAVSGEVTGTTSDPLTYNKAGEHFIKWEFKDDFGNTSFITQRVEIFDFEPPIIQVKENITLNLDQNGDATLSVLQVDEGSTDNCAIDSISLSKSTFSLADLGENSVTFKIIDKSGNISEKSIIVTVTNTTLSNENWTLENKIAIYPNPTLNRVFIKVHKTLEVKTARLFSVEGKKVLTMNIIPEFIDISFLSKGIYFLTISTKNTSFTKKIIKN
ncbi:MAG: T9SS type A sorting domain-containing protein [Polaribacter sp.]|nr:T9SS type A sorting domain-containing protein [Polaribacter sp.]MDG1811866.1 T9SS type A sorting domain-containing protein [Polaribacter sp.]MDG1993016.1 T9SS type A sorting domain-containing protein [Polaribacter sp.]